jgi:hypothetical protein
VRDAKRCLARERWVRRNRDPAIERIVLNKVCRNQVVGNCASDWRGSNSNCMPTKRESSSLAALRSKIGEIAARANRKRSTSWVLRTAAGKPGRGISRYCARRCARGGKLSCGLGKKNCGDACTRPFGNRERTCARSCWGHFRYYGVPMNGPALCAFRKAAGYLWWTVLRRRSQGNHLPWRRMRRYIARWFPPARVCHPYPLVRLGVLTQGGSRMR